MYPHICQICEDEFQSVNRGDRFCSAKCQGQHIKSQWPKRLWLNIAPADENGCKRWMGCKNRRGYGKHTANGKLKFAHRLVYELHHGPIPDGMVVCHSCDHPWCCAIEHLWLGTRADNNRDRDKKGRGVRGEGNAHSKLTNENVREIKSSTAKQAELAIKFGVSLSAISHVRRGAQWKHVDLPESEATR